MTTDVDMDVGNEVDVVIVCFSQISEIVSLLCAQESSHSLALPKTYATAAAADTQLHKYACNNSLA